MRSIAGLGLALILLLDGAVFYAYVSSPILKFDIPAQRIGKETGYAWYSPIELKDSWFFVLRSDDGNAPRASGLLLFENDRLLGPPHTTHQTIRDVGKGGWSHWRGTLFFASSDNTSPAENGRTYRVEVPKTLSNNVLIGAIVLNLLVFLGFGIRQWLRMTRGLNRPER